MVLCAAHVRMEKDFDRWNEIKKATNAADEAARLYFREGEIWWVRLGHNIGYEADGKSQEFTRPVVVLKKYNQYSFLALPLTASAWPTRRSACAKSCGRSSRESISTMPTTLRGCAAASPVCGASYNNTST